MAARTRVALALISLASLCKYVSAIDDRDFHIGDDVAALADFDFDAWHDNFQRRLGHIHSEMLELSIDRSQNDKGSSRADRTSLLGNHHSWSDTKSTDTDKDTNSRWDTKSDDTDTNSRWDTKSDDTDTDSRWDSKTDDKDTDSRWSNTKSDDKDTDSRWSNTKSDTKSDESSEDDDDDDDGVDKSLRIAIIGGGPSGLFTARELRKKGFKNIEIFEAEPEVAALAHLYTTDGHINHEPGTASIPKFFYPPDMQSDPDVYPPLLEILEETETVLRGSYIVNESQSRLSAVRDYPDPMPQVFPQTLGATNALEFVQGLMTVLAVKQLIHGAHSLEDMTKLSITFPGQTFEQWSDAMGLGCFVDVWSEFADVLGSPPTRDTLASSFLMSLKHFVPDIMRRFVRRTLAAMPGGFNVTAIPNAYLRYILEIDDPGAFVYTEGGYQTVFNNIAKIESAHGTKIHLNSRIDKVKTSWFTRTLRISIEHKGWVHENFDAVIVATRPKQAIEILPWSHPAIDMLSGTVTEAYNWFLWNQSRIDKVWPYMWPSGAPGVVIFGDSADNLGQPEIGELGGCQPFEVIRDHPSSSVLLSYSHKGQELSNKECFRETVKTLKKNGFSVKKRDIIASGRHPYPVHLSQEQEADDWFGKFDEYAQGHDSIFFTGELFAGVSVPVQLDYAIHWVPKLVERLRQSN